MSEAAEQPERIAKLLARVGLCSRRDAERWIARQQAFWTGAVDQLDRLLREEARRDES